MASYPMHTPCLSPPTSSLHPLPFLTSGDWLFLLFFMLCPFCRSQFLKLLQLFFFFINLHVQVSGVVDTAPRWYGRTCLCVCIGVYRAFSASRLYRALMVELDVLLVSGRQQPFCRYLASWVLQCPTAHQEPYCAYRWHL